MKKAKIILQLVTLIAFLSFGLLILIYTITKDGPEKEDDGLPIDVVIDSYNPEPLNHEGRYVFELHCKRCHSLDEVVIGPALRGVYDLRDSTWIRQMIKDGSSLINNGDSLANELYHQYGKFDHPNYENIDDPTLNKLIEYLKLEGQKSFSIP